MAEIEANRVRELNGVSLQDGKYVLYWMQQSQRTRYNHALEFSIQLANELDKPLVVCFGLMDDYPEANLRHYNFMLEGLRDVESGLRERGIKFVLRLGSPPDVALDLGADACAIVCDRGYLKIQKSWRAQVADGAECAVFEVESDVVVPVEVASNKPEYAARTIRPKINKIRDKFLVPLRSTPVRHESLKLKGLSDEDLASVDKLCSRLKLSREPSVVSEFFVGGEVAAARALKSFLAKKFDGYTENRNHPDRSAVSHMGMYLHFGQISALDIAIQVSRMPASLKVEKETYLEELIIRRELAMNFVNFNSAYDSYSGLPSWARIALEAHAEDEREFVYSEEDFEYSRTHDVYWNACMDEMRYTGYMHNYMRMYWGKKVLEWSASPTEAYRILIKLNNKYFLCGRDPNAFSNVLWVFGLHDRPWARRPVYGTIRSMSASGLERKMDIDAYVAMVASFKARALRAQRG